MNESVSCSLRMFENVAEDSMFLYKVTRSIDEYELTAVVSAVSESSAVKLLWWDEFDEVTVIGSSFLDKECIVVRRVCDG